MADASKYSETQRQELAGRLVSQEVIVCVSTLVSDLSVLLSQASTGALNQVSTTYDEIIELSSSRDYYDPCVRHIEDMDRDDLLEVASDMDIEITDDMSFKDIRAKVISELRELDSDAIQAFADTQSVEPDECEVYEYWAVSSYLASKLSDKGEVTGNICDLQVWGRTCTGQSMVLDSVIQQIAVELYGE